MKVNKTACLAFTLGEEGGFVNDPRDPGGATKFGITLPTLRRWSGDPSLGIRDIFALTTETACAIYTDEFWSSLWTDDLPPGVDLMVFDFGVNVGCGRSIRLLQIAAELTGGAIDGRIGPATMRAANKVLPAELVKRLSLAQRRYYTGLPGYRIYGRGWTSRTDRRGKLATKMADPISVTADTSHGS